MRYSLSIESIKRKELRGKTRKGLCCLCNKLDEIRIVNCCVVSLNARGRIYIFSVVSFCSISSVQAHDTERYSLPFGFFQRQNSRDFRSAQ